MNRLWPLYILVLFAFTGLHAQVNDAGLWASVNIEKKLTQAWSLNLSEELRLYENYTELGTVITDFGLNYKFNKNFRISGNYRFVNKREVADYYSSRHRFYIDLTIREKVKPLVFTGRVRMQHQYEDVFTSENGYIPENYIRTKATCKLDLDKVYSPYISGEIYNPLFSGTATYIDKVRYSAGIDYSLNNASSLDVFYMIQSEYNTKNLRKDFVLGLGYSFKF
ncbi:MAG: hypothetical protein CVU05_01475 [Bacteroidetes bacterium HGW-Bacteroidetes-21]|jgi:hypothetical protein|nr:MAG: hypothetical protein CVU05_01475 [Bacteroidetes bacterium HGW-Bacteroidetes-21]